MTHEEHTLEPAEERALEELLRTARDARSQGRAEGELGRLVLALERADEADPETVERLVDAVYDEYANATGRVGTLELLSASLRRSPLLRVLAASVALHALVLPVLAYMAWTPEPPPPYRLTFQLPDRSPASVEADEAAREREELDGLDPSEAFDGPGPAAEADALALRRAAAGADGAVDAALPGALAELVAEGAPSVAADADPARVDAHAVALELRLDEWSLRAGAAEDDLRARAEALAVHAGASPLVDGALARARAYGLLPGADASDHAGVDLAAWRELLRASGVADADAVAAWRAAAATR